MDAVYIDRDRPDVKEPKSFKDLIDDIFAGPPEHVDGMCEPLASTSTFFPHSKPVELTPKSVHDKLRLEEIEKVLFQHISSKKFIPYEWIKERGELLKRIIK